MSATRQCLLPFDDLEPASFEAFVLHFLGAKISLAVIEKAKTPTGEGSSHARYQIINATLYGGAGPAGQDGIDIRATTETGAEWVFQCKHYASPFNESKAEKAVEKAEKEYSKASRYFLLLSGEPTPAVRKLVEERPRWEVWGRSELSIRFFNEVPVETQIGILRKFFPKRSEALIAGLFPQHDDPLITTEEFFKRWNEPGRIFNHRAELVGRTDELANLDRFAADPATRVLILAAPGGVGKTRLLRAFGEGFEQRHPGKKLYFFDPAARSNVASDRLRVAAKQELVLVQDDAHRNESLRADLVSSLYEQQGKLILTTRPHAVESLVSWLGGIGIDASHVEVLPTLTVLNRQQLVELALACLPPDHRAAAESLADIAKGCSLIVTVACALISQGKMSATSFVDSTEFRRVVFDRFESEGFDEIAGGHRTTLVRETLRLLAVLAPWTHQVLSLDGVAKFLGCTVREFQENFDRLRAAGLLIETRSGWRVIPDLFADYLVFHGCYEGDGRLTDFALRLQHELLVSANGIVLRNLAEAEWQAQLTGQTVESLLDPFWQNLQKKFIEEDFWSRAQLIRQWKQFAVLQPERSLELAKMAFDLESAPRTRIPRGNKRAIHLESHERVLAELPGLLEPVATYHDDYRAAALNLLWELHRKTGRVEDNAQNDPLHTIARVVRYQARHPIRASQGVIDWLAGMLRGSQAAEICDGKVPVMSVILKPVFERDVEDNFATGRTFHFRTLPLSIANTKPIRDAALKLLVEQVIPRGEVPTLNALGVLEAAIGVVRPRWKSEAAAELQEQWVSERRAALAIVEELIHPGQSVRVLLRIRRMLRPLAVRDPHPGFRADCNRVLALIADTPELRLATVLLSSEWEEFVRDLRQDEESFKDLTNKAEIKWRKLCESVANEMLGAYPNASALHDQLTHLLQEYDAAGTPAQLESLLGTFARVNPAVATELIRLILTVPNSPLDRWWVTLLAAQRRLPDLELKGWIQKVLREDNPDRWRPILFALHWAGVGKVSDNELEAVADWAKRLRDENLHFALEHVRMRYGERNPVADTILENLPLPSLSTNSLEALAKVLDRPDRLNGDPLPSTFTDAFIGQLQRVDRIDWHGAESFLNALAKLRPVPFFEMLRDRITRAEQEGEESEFLPMPFLSLNFDALPEAEGYPDLAGDLFVKVQDGNRRTSIHWRRLFQAAVLQVSPLGLEFLERWLPQTKDAEELLTLIETLRFDGSMVIFTKPDFARAVLQRARQVAPARFEEIRWYLGRTASPQMRGYTEHVLDPAQRYYREEAAKAASVHSSDLELSALYREIVRHEDADAARHKREAEVDLVEL